MTNAKDLTNKTYGVLTVLSRLGSDKRGFQTWNCVCICGNETIKSTYQLTKNQLPNCGCKGTKHGHSKRENVSSEYKAWIEMKRRCNNKNFKDYSLYGGRGINYCSRWENFEFFIEDMGIKPDKTYSLDRINTNKGYSKENCRWADARTQAINQRINKHNKSGYKNVSWCIKSNKWRVTIMLNRKQKYLGCFKCKQQAVNVLNEYIKCNKLQSLGYEVQQWKG